MIFSRVIFQIVASAHGGVAFPGVEAALDMPHLDIGRSSVEPPSIDPTRLSKQPSLEQSIDMHLERTRAEQGIDIHQELQTQQDLHQQDLHQQDLHQPDLLQPEFEVDQSYEFL